MFLYWIFRHVFKTGQGKGTIQKELSYFNEHGEEGSYLTELSWFSKVITQNFHN